MATRLRGTMVQDPSTLLAFGAVVLFGGLNALAVKASNAELAPYWGAALRFGAGALVLGAIAGFRRIPLPRGRALVGTVLFGVVNYTAFFAFLYHALLAVPAGLAMVLLALAPLLTLLLAALLGQERLRVRGVVGAMVAVTGTALVFREGVGAGVPIGSALLVLGGAASIAVASVIVKGFPKVDPVASNLVAMTVGAVGLLALSGASGEPWAIPIRTETWLALAYLVLLGSVALFVLVVFVIGRWNASASSFAVVLMPLVTVPVAAVLAREPVTPVFVLGAAIVLVAVYLGTLSRPGAAERAVPQAVTTPGC